MCIFYSFQNNEPKAIIIKESDIMEASATAAAAVAVYQMRLRRFCGAAQFLSISHTPTTNITGVLIADPLCAGDEKLVLLLSPDSPSPAHYPPTHSAHHLLVQLCSQHVSVNGSKNCREAAVVHV